MKEGPHGGGFAINQSPKSTVPGSEYDAGPHAGRTNNEGSVEGLHEEGGGEESTSAWAA